MSLTTVKRVLSQMDAAQMEELLLDLYKARPEAKEYLDFFAQPDIDKRLDKAKTNIRKELTRTSRGRNRGRSTRVRRFIKDIVSLNPGAEPVIEVMTYAVETAAEVGANPSVWIKEATQRAIARLLTETIVYADSAGMLNLCLPRLEAAVAAMRDPSRGASSYKQLLADTLRDAVDGL